MIGVAVFEISTNIPNTADVAALKVKERLWLP
jgi:hypothetical protein